MRLTEEEIRRRRFKALDVIDAAAAQGRSPTNAEFVTAGVVGRGNEADFLRAMQSDGLIVMSGATKNRTIVATGRVPDPDVPARRGSGLNSADLWRMAVKAVRHAMGPDFPIKTPPPWVDGAVP